MGLDAKAMNTTITNVQFEVISVQLQLGCFSMNFPHPKQSKLIFVNICLVSCPWYCQGSLMSKDH